MDPINPWLDADEVRKLAESLMPARTLPAASINDAGFSDAFVGFAAPAPVAATTPVAAPSPIVTPSPFSISTPVAAPRPAAIPATVQTPATISPAPSLQAFQSSIQQSHLAECLFIIDQTGKTVFGEDHYPQFHFIARSLTQNAERRAFPKGHIHIKIGPAKTLEIISLQLPNRAWVAGVIVPQPLPTETISKWVGELSGLISSIA